MANSYNDSHAKILRAGQYLIESNRFIVQAPKVFKKTKEQDVDESTKRIEDLHNEIKKLEDEIAKKQEEGEKQSNEIVRNAEANAEKIISEAEKGAFERVKKSMEEKEGAVAEQSQEGENILSKAKEDAAEIIRQANEESTKIKGQARQEGFEAGRDEGYNEGREEIKSMIERLHSIIAVTIKEREKILINSERQIMNLVLTMVKKIVKKLTQEDSKVVINNVKEALSLIRGAMMVYIHVNRGDFDFVSRHKNELIKLIEGMPEVKILEDPSVDKGGVYIETDIGEIDAKIGTQLEEIENKIKYYMPVKVQGKMADSKEDKIGKEEIEDDASHEAEKSLMDKNG